MKVIFVIASTLDGKITKGDTPGSRWPSDEDHEHFLSMIKKSKVLVMGRTTYEASGKNHDSERLRVVLTRQPERYKAEEIPGQVEFTSESPSQCVNALTKRGFEELLLVSGPEITTEFFKAGLVDEVYLTLEPRLFGKGKSVVSDEEIDVQLELLESKKLNEKGTLLLHYRVNR